MERRSRWRGTLSIAYSPGGDQIAFGYSDYTVVIWNILTGDCQHILRGHSDNVTVVAYSPQGDQVASASEDTTVRLWDVETGECLHTLTGHTKSVECIAYSPNGSQIASGSRDCTVRLWDVKTGEYNHMPLEHDGRITKVVYSPQGDHVASVASTKGHNILLWDVKTERLLHTLADNGKLATQIVYSHQGDLVASAGSDDYYDDSEDDAIIRLWDAETGVCLRLLAGHSQDIRSVVFSPKGDRIISCSEDKTVRIWDVGVRTSQRTSSSHIGDVHLVKCSPKGDQVASCSSDMTVRLWDVETGACRHILRGHDKKISCIAYSPEGDQIATGSDGGTIRLWDVESGRCTHTLTDHSKTVNEIIYSLQRNHQLASCSSDGTVRLWNVGSGECLRTLCSGVQSAIDHAAFSPDGSQIAGVLSYQMDQDHYTMYLCDTVTGRQIWASEIHTERITSIVYSSRGDVIVSASEDQTVRLWDTVSGQRRAVIQDFQHEVCDIAWLETPNAQYVVAGCKDGVVGMWQVIMDEDRCQVHLHWRTTNGTFDVQDATIQGVKGLNSLNKWILMGQEAVEEGNENEGNEESREAVNQRVSPPPLTPFRVFLKRMFEFDEEDEDVVKRMRGNEGVSSMDE
ncbi:MAG: WD40-repeat-containing domain protein [Benniella sp.]|nr:MAG: WD40-repeat-containing domain protein [Benniella sp.]